MIVDVLLAQLQETPLLEAASVLLAAAYLLLVIRQNIFCWYCAAASSAIYVWLFIDARLYMESLLYVFYVAMAIYGWLLWRTSGANQNHPVVKWSRETHAYAIAAVIAAGSISGWLLSNYSEAAYPFIDSFTTFTAIWATYLVARKVLENWWYWLAIDSVSVFIYWSRGLELTALLFLLYVVLIPFGILKWMRSYGEQSEVDS